MKTAKSTTVIRIQASGPCFDLDYTVPEKKAAAELRRLKALYKTAVLPLINRWRDNRAYTAWRPGYRRKGKYVRGAYVKMRPRPTHRDLQTILGSVEPTKIICTRLPQTA